MVINMLDPELLRTFLAVERAGGFTAAGRLLGLRQSTVSGHIARLEQAVGRELFRRDTRNLALTADGAAMVIHANVDDMMTDPSGNSGARIACGVLVAG